MTDPVSALALACGIIQIVQAGCTLTKTCCEIYDGSSSLTTQNERLEQQSDGFNKAIAVLTSRMEYLKTVDGPLSPEDRRLESTAKECESHARNITERLDHLKQAKKRKRDAPKLLWNNQKQKRDLEDLHTKLQQCQSLLDTQMLQKLLLVLPKIVIYHNVR